MEVFEVELDDGRVLDIEADSEEQAMQVAQQFLADEQAAPQQEQGGGLGQLVPGLARVGQALTQGPSGLAMLAGDLTGLGPRGQAGQQTAQQGVDAAAHAAAAGMLRTGAGIVNLATTAAGKILDTVGADGIEQRILDWRDSTFRPATETALHDLRTLRRTRFADLDIVLDEHAEDFYEKAAEFAVQLPAGGGSVTGAKALGTLARGIMFGGLTSGISFNEDNPDTQLGNAALGAAFGGILGLIPATAVGLRLWMQKRAKDIDNADAQRFFQIAEKYNTQGSVGQATGHNLMISLERRQPDRSLKVLIDQSAAVQNRVQSMVKAMPDVPASRIAEVAGQSVRRAQALLRKRRSATFKSGMRKIESLHPDAKIAGANLLRAMDSIDAVVKRRALSDIEMSAGFHRQHARVRNAMQQGGLNVRDVNDLLVALEGVSSGRMGSLFRNAEASGVTDLQREYARQLRNALLDDLASAETSGAFSKQASGIMRAIREDYTAVSAEIKGVQRTLLAKMAKLAPDDPDLEAKLSKMIADAPIAEQARMVRTLRGMGTNGMRTVQGARKLVLQRAVNAGLGAAKSLPENVQKFDLVAFNNALSSTQQELIGGGLFSADQKKELLEAAFFIRKVLNRPGNNRGLQGVPTILPEEVSINAISQNPAFLSRLLTRVLTMGTSMESLLFDQRGREIIKQLATAPSDSPAMRSAIAKLTILASEPEFYGEDNAEH